jgi:hypothetical protein
LQTIKLFSLSALAVIAFDAIASAASLALGFSYAYASVGSAVLYIALAFYGARKLGFSAAVLLGAVMGVTDATIGWAISWSVGPGRLPEGTLTLSIWLITTAFVVFLGVIYGLVGGGVGAFLARRRTA